MELESPFQYRPRFHSEPYKRHYEARVVKGIFGRTHRRQSPTSSAESPLEHIKTSTNMLRRRNEKKMVCVVIHVGINSGRTRSNQLNRVLPARPP